jgi:hypothetical protein
MMVSSKRKMLAARDDLADQVSEIAASKGFTLFHMLNNMLELAIKANDVGTTLDETVDTYITMKAVKEASFTLILESLLYETAETAYGKAKEKTSKIWFEAGEWVAKQYITRGIEDPFAVIGRDLKTFSWNIPEFTMDTVKGVISVRVLSPRFSESYTMLLTRYIIRHKEVGKGNIRLEATKK